MLTITLEPHGAQPLYEQLYRGIRHKIEQGALAAGCLLYTSPSPRD